MVLESFSLECNIQLTKRYYYERWRNIRIAAAYLDSLKTFWSIG
jgi:hypothetical protein